MTEAMTDELTHRLTDYAAALQVMGAIRSHAVEHAFATVPRHLFVPRFWFRGREYGFDPLTVPSSEVLDIVYTNNSLITHTGGSGEPLSSSSAPSIMARMLEALDLRRGHRVLEIGAGTGYNAALIHTVTQADVTTVEAGRTAATEARTALGALGLDSRVHVVHADGYPGWPDTAPFDRVIVTCGVAGIPNDWLNQLSLGARILLPLAHAGAHPVLRVNQSEPGHLHGRIIRWGDFMPASGRLRPNTLFAHDPAEDIPTADIRTLHGVGPSLSADQYNDLWCYLGIHDPRTTRAYPGRDDAFDPALGACALVDDTSGAAWIHQDGSMTVAGTRAPERDVAALVDRWDRDGRPTADGWHTDFGLHTGTGLWRPLSWQRYSQ